MKTFSVLLVLSVAALFNASAQVSMELALDQDQFLPNEPIRLAVKISNTSGQQLHLGEDPTWLTFSVESLDDFIVAKNGDVPVVGPFDLESSQMATKHVNIAPYFQMDRPGRYKVTATMHVKQWGLAVSSTPIHLDVIHGADLWSQDFGVLVATNLPPESRKYTLLKANYLHEQLRLYVQVGSSDGGEVYKVQVLGPLVSFNQPEEQVDRNSLLHVLWQTGAQSFTYAIVNPKGQVITDDTYDNFNSRPRLSITSEGDVVVLGGVRRPKAGDLPSVQMPAPAPMPAPSAPRAAKK